MPRKRISLDGSWDFWIDPQGAYETNRLPEEARRTIAVPAPWQPLLAQEGERFDAGVGWYRRQVDLPGWDETERLVLHIGAADRLSEVWWNGTRVGRHEGGYLPFEVDVTESARAGANELVVRVADLLEGFGEAPHGKQSWYGLLSGIWQPVWLERRPRYHIRGLRITPQGEQVHVQVRLNRLPEASPRFHYRALAPDGSTADEGNASGLEFSFTVADALAWDVESPNLYRLEVRLEGDSTDEWAETFGFRTIEARAGRLLLNGRPIMLRGALDQDYYPGGVYTPPTPEMFEDQLRKAKAMGLNCMRVHIKAADPRYYEAADRLGLLIWTELPNWRTLTPESSRQGWETLEGILERDWNHPSIIIWTIINENWGTNLAHDPSHRAWLAETYAALKARDPLRLVVDNSACYGNFHVITDIEDFHNYYAIPDHYQNWRSWVDAFASRAPWTFVPLFDGIEDWQRYQRRPWEPVERPYAPEVRRTGEEPLVLSEFGNWGLPELDQLRACFGGRDPWWFETGYEWDEGVVYPHGVERRFRDYALDTVFGDLASLARASQWAQFYALKYEIEQIRRHESLSGYVITEFTDVHWECNGLLDMCRNPKVYHERLPEINANDMFVPEWTRLAFWPGETVEIGLLFSHYSGLDLSGARLTWRLEGFPEAAGQSQMLNPQPYGVSDLGAVRFRAPEVDYSRRALLMFELHDPSDRLAARGTQEIYILPRPSFEGLSAQIWAPDFGDLLEGLLPLTGQLASAQIAAVYDLTETAYAFAQHGGQVLWLAERPQPVSAFLSPPNLPSVRARRGTPLQGDWASSLSWIRTGEVFRDLPTENVVNFAFADLTPENVITVPPFEFPLHVHAGIFAGWLQKNAALVAEFPLGAGRVLACTFRIGERLANHPTAAAMFQQMLAYLQKDSES